MALQKDIPTPQGIDASYHMIENLAIKKKQERASIIVAGYKNETVRKSNPDSGVLVRDNQEIRGKTFGNLWQDVVIDKKKRVYEAVYDFLKTLPRYENATDVIE